MKSFLPSTIKQFEYYKKLGDQTLEQLSFEALKQEFNQDSNSIAIIVNHLAGNMLSRFTNFLSEDGEKEWRKRDEEFIDTFNTEEELIAAWNKGWDGLFNAIKPLTESDLEQIVYIRNEGHTVAEAIIRQMMHYAYHIGQIVFLGKMIKGKDWISLSIPKGKSQEYNAAKFKNDKIRKHFTDDA